ncbi:MAG: hypothetical protein PHD81_04770 [Candidatus Nanoarchaeia archaeon]|nr:hypothetical protein [Candidatus Nanoarchaeia archaeon]MDD5588390.1 hypothetical protein [Candidatus Nanoarchaeia archaeon]
MSLVKKIEDYVLIGIAIMAILLLTFLIGVNITGFVVYNPNYEYTGNETAYEIINSNNFDKILTSSKGVIDYNIINKGNGDLRWNWKEQNGLVMLCNSDIENCSLDLNATTEQYWYLSQNFSSINQNSGEDSIFSWLDKEQKTQREFWTGFEDLPLDQADKDYNDVFFQVQKKKDLILINLEKQASGYSNPTNIIFHFDSSTWFVTYKISKHIYDGKWNNSKEEIFEATGDLEYGIFYDDSKNNQWIQFEFKNITDTGDVDNDSVINEYDNCLDVYNPEQNNSDTDYFGDECDNCDFVNNEDQMDTDFDGVGDDCEPTCIDEMQNGDETGIDCGGSCPSCNYKRMLTIENEITTNILTLYTSENITNITFNKSYVLAEKGNLSIAEFILELDINNIFINGLFEMYYNQSKLIELDINESSLNLYVNNTLISADYYKENNYYNLSLYNFVNVFSLIGEKNAHETSGDSGGGGGGGGGSSGGNREGQTIVAPATLIQRNLEAPETPKNIRNLESVNHCENGVKDANEIGIDCGVNCPKCSIGVYAFYYLKLVVPWIFIVIIILIILYLIEINYLKK